MQSLRYIVVCLLVAMVFILLPVDASMEESYYNQIPDIQLETHKNEEAELSSHSRMKRKIYYFEHYSSKKWTTTIEFYVDEELTDEQTRLLHWVIESDFEKNTCIRFHQIYNTSAVSHQFIWFKGNEEYSTSTCKAYIGRENDTRTFHGQPIFLGDWCFNYRGTLIHMIGATLGMFNELQRPDRDDYVDVLEDNIVEEGLSNFVKQGERGVLTHVPYDYASALHYHAAAWLKPSLKFIHYIPQPDDSLSYTVRPKDPRLFRLLGQRSELSFYDAKILNDAYCSEVCTNTIQCSNGGYQDPNSCEKCKCPDGYAGDFCEDFAENVQNPNHQCNPLSDNVEVTDQEACVSSPGYDQQVPYSTGDHCTWVLKAPKGKYIDMWFQESRFYLPYASKDRALCIHWVEIKYKGMNYTRGPRYCGLDNDNEINTLPTKFSPLTSEVSDVMVLFKSPQGHLRVEYKSGARTGFKLCFKISTATPSPTSPTPTSAVSPTSTHLPPDPNIQSGQVKSDDDDDDDDDATHSKTNMTPLVIGVIAALLLLLLIFGIVIIVLLYRRRKKKPAAVVMNNGVSNPGYAHTVPIVTFHNPPGLEKKIDGFGAFGVSIDDLPPKYDDEFPVGDKVPAYAISDGDHTNMNVYTQPVYKDPVQQSNASRKPLPPEPDVDYENAQTAGAVTEKPEQADKVEEPLYQNAVNVKNLRQKFQ